MEELTYYDAGGVQIVADFEASISGAPCYDATVRFEVIENANQVLGQAMAKDTHEDHKCNLFEGATSVER
jgi:hypothetical protein